MGEIHKTSDPLSILPPDLIEAVTAFAERDAATVGAYLTAQMLEALTLIGADPDLARWQDVCPPSFLLELASALRICEWERHDLITAAMGLPDGNSALQTVCEQIGNREIQPSLSCRVMTVFVTTFAWNGLANLGIDVVLDKLNENDFVDRVAEILWRNRHSGGGHG